ncbi:hypothetical protein B7463_g8995, partial [Scytalidium lignicola]
MAISQATMAHVNMMTDTIIANLAPDGLRSVIRGILASDPDATPIFEKQTRSYLQKSTPKSLGPILNVDDTGRMIVTDDFISTQNRVRCMLGCGLCWNSLPILKNIIDRMVELNPSQQPSYSSKLLDVLNSVDGDIVQAVTALTKTLLHSNGSREFFEHERESLEELLESLKAGSSKWRQSGLPFPFERGLGALFKLLNTSNDECEPTRTPRLLNLKKKQNWPPTGIEIFELQGIKLPRLFCGLWQLSSPAWGSASHPNIINQFLQHVHAGLWAFDMADHYGDAEILFYDDPHYIDALCFLQEDNRVRALGLCNFDTEHMKNALDNGITIATNQVQFSLIDSRPTVKMAKVCQEYDIKLLTYGTLCGGFIADKWLGKPEPELFLDTITPSQRKVRQNLLEVIGQVIDVNYKYYEVICSWGGWTLFQELLHTLKQIAVKHGVSISNVATRWVLDFPYVGAVIVGVRMGIMRSTKVIFWNVNIPGPDIIPPTAKNILANLLNQSLERPLESKRASEIKARFFKVSIVHPPKFLTPTTPSSPSSSSSPSPSSTTTNDATYKSGPLDIAKCGDFPNAKDVQIIVKTGANEIYEKFPTQLLTELRCYDDLLVFSDLEQDVGPYHVYDALINVTDSVKQSSSDFDYYRLLQEYKETGQDIAALRPTSGSGAGWNLDKFKFLHMLEKTWALRPERKWYVFIEADTYLVRSNLLLWLQRLDPSKALYMGSPTNVNGDSFAHGGSGIILSGVALAKFAKDKPGIAPKYDEKLLSLAYGDQMLMKALADVGVDFTKVWPMLQAEKPSTIPFGAGPDSGTRHWCQPIVTMHHITSDEASAIWRFEQQRPDMQKPLLINELYSQFIAPRIRPSIDNWYNLSDDVIYTAPENPDPRNKPADQMSDLEKVAHKSFKDCGRACEEQPRCYQWVYFGDKCGFSHSYRFGRKRMPEDGVKYKSGFVLDKIEKDRKEHNCKSPQWLG